MCLGIRAVIIRFSKTHLCRQQICLPPAIYWLFAWLSPRPWGICSSETSVYFYRTKQRHIPEDGILQNQLIIKIREDGIWKRGIKL
jgi:hypothetical protein